MFVTVIRFKDGTVVPFERMFTLHRPHQQPPRDVAWVAQRTAKDKLQWLAPEEIESLQNFETPEGGA